MEQIAISHCKQYEKFFLLYKTVFIACELAHHPACNQIPMDESGFFTQCLIGAKALCCPKGFKKGINYAIKYLNGFFMLRLAW